MPSTERRKDKHKRLPSLTIAITKCECQKYRQAEGSSSDTKLMLGFSATGLYHRDETIRQGSGHRPRSRGKRKYRMNEKSTKASAENNNCNSVLTDSQN
jgi:hypothetical protein